MKIKDIISFLEKTAPLSLQESYDNCGLIVGDRNIEISNTLITLDCTEDVVEEAIKNNCGLIISHHPIVFSGLKKITGKNYIERTIIKAIKNDIAIYAIHTNLDKIIGGVNTKISEKIGLENCKILSPDKMTLRKLVTFCPTDNLEEIKNALFEAGAGKIGEYDECSFSTEGTGSFRASENTNPYVGEKNKQHQEKETRIETVYPLHKESEIINNLAKNHPYEEVAYDIYTINNTYKNIGAGLIGNLKTETSAKEFLLSLKTIFGIDCIKHTDIIKDKIKKVAVCGGSGSSLLNSAISKNADIFITADVKYHQFFDAENKIILADIGHFESEQFTKELLYDILTENFPKFAFHFSKVNTNPINYL